MTTTPNLAAFVKTILSSDFTGCLSCDADLHELAIKHGIMQTVPFDPAVHSDPDQCAQAGDLWMDFTDGAKALFSAPPPPPSHHVDGPADQIIIQIEELFPNWRSYRDLVDCITCELHELRKRAEGQS